MTFQDSEIAHRYLDDLIGIEIGASAHNPFHLPNCLNVDFTDDMTTVFKKAEVGYCGHAAKVDIVAHAEKLPLENESIDYVISSHVIEHIFDPISALLEWKRVVKKGGYIFIIAPLKDYVPGEIRPITTVQELKDRHEGKRQRNSVDMLSTIDAANTEQINETFMHRDLATGIICDHETGHFTVFDLQLMVNICNLVQLKVIRKMATDDKVGNGFCVITQV